MNELKKVNLQAAAYTAAYTAARAAEATAEAADTAAAKAEAAAEAAEAYAYAAAAARAAEAAAEAAETHLDWLWRVVFFGFKNDSKLAKQLLNIKSDYVDIEEIHVSRSNTRIKFTYQKAGEFITKEEFVCTRDYLQWVEKSNE